MSSDLFNVVSRTAEFSRDRVYRYTLMEHWGSRPGFIMWIGLNPSTADEISDDNTVRRCKNFSKAWGFGGFCMTNIFAFRATDPKAMMSQEYPVGPDNDRYLQEIYQDASIVIAAWGTHGTFRGREGQVAALLGPLQCLGVTKDGHPKHPLYLKNGLEPVPWPG